MDFTDALAVDLDVDFDRLISEGKPDFDRLISISEASPTDWTRVPDLDPTWTRLDLELEGSDL
jgi:hypothetical protein